MKTIERAHYNGATTLTAKRVELNDYYKDYEAIDHFFEGAFTIAEWAYVMEHYPYAWRNVELLRRSTLAAIERMER